MTLFSPSFLHFVACQDIFMIQRLPRLTHPGTFEHLDIAAPGISAHLNLALIIKKEFNLLYLPH